VNVEKQVAHWLKSAKEDWDVAGQLLQSGKIRHGLFFVHLTIEKALKAIYTKRLSQVPPKIHRLEELALKCGLKLSAAQTQVIGNINTYNLEGRYQDEDADEIDEKSAKELQMKASEVYQWLVNQL
jgi:HEPN domain-containing protein